MPEICYNCNRKLWGKHKIILINKAVFEEELRTHLKKYQHGADFIDYIVRR